MQQLVITISALGFATIAYAVCSALDSISGYFRNLKHTGDKTSEKNNI